MFFYSFIGNDEYQDAFIKLVKQHSENLGLTQELIHNDVLADETPFTLLWRYHPNLHLKPYISLNEHKARAIAGFYKPGYEAPSEGAMSYLDPGNPIRIEIDKQRWSFIFDVPVLSVEQVYYYADSRGVLVSTDLRIFLKWTIQDLEPAGVYSMLQYGNVPPPLTLIKNVHRVPYGHQLRIVEGEGFPKAVNKVPPILEWPKHPGADTPQETMLSLVDSRLSELPPGIGIFYSGGVDSVFLAGRLAKLGREDILLVNSAFGKDDPESIIAEKIAEILNMPFRRIDFVSGIMVYTLDHIGANYSYPFGDEATVAMNMMFRSCMELSNQSVVLDGIGADNGFGIGYKTKWWTDILQSFPRNVLQKIDDFYKPFKPWWSRNFKFEKPWRMAHFALSMDRLALGGIAQHAMGGLAFTIPDDIHEVIRDVHMETIDALSRGMDDKSKLSIFGVLHESLDAFNNKSYDLMKHQGVETVCPFHEGPLFRFGNSISWEQKSPDGIEKTLLKKPLVDQIPKELIYRKKCGFIPPLHKTLLESEIQDRFRFALLDEHSPLTGYINKDFYRELLDRGYAGKSISHGAMKCLWATTFTSLWYIENIAG